MAVNQCLLWSDYSRRMWSKRLFLFAKFVDLRWAVQVCQLCNETALVVGWHEYLLCYFESIAWHSCSIEKITTGPVSKIITQHITFYDVYILE